MHNNNFPYKFHLNQRGGPKTKQRLSTSDMVSVLAMWATISSTIALYLLKLSYKIWSDASNCVGLHISRSLYILRYYSQEGPQFRQPGSTRMHSAALGSDGCIQGCCFWTWVLQRIWWVQWRNQSLGIIWLRNTSLIFRTYRLLVLPISSQWYP